MTRYQELREELKALYAKSAQSTDKRTIKEIESRISYLETEAAAIPR